MIKSGKVGNQQTTEGLASFCFLHQNLFFPVGFFSINFKPLSLVFVISHRFSPITSRYFHHYLFKEGADLRRKVQNRFFTFHLTLMI